MIHHNSRHIGAATKVTRRTLMAGGAALGAASFASAASATQWLRSKPHSAQTAGTRFFCRDSHAYQVSALMVSMGSPALSPRRKSSLMAKAACPTCGHSFSGDLMAEIVCQGVELDCSTAHTV